MSLCREFVRFQGCFLIECVLYPSILSACPLLGAIAIGLSSFTVFFIKGLYSNTEGACNSIIRDNSVFIIYD